MNYELLTTNKRQRRFGFTLIELLIAITIIGILSSIITYGLVGQQKKARDAQRKSDLKQVKTALQSAKNDCRAAAYYPIMVANPPDATKEARQFYDPSAGTDSLLDQLIILKYMNTTLTDPKNTGNYQYLYDFGTPTDLVCPSKNLSLSTSGVADYVLRVALEDTNDPSLKSSYAKCSDKFLSVSFPSDPTIPKPADSDNNDIDDHFFYFECNE